MYKDDHVSSFFLLKHNSYKPELEIQMLFTMP